MIEKESEGGWRAGFRIGVTLAFATAALGVSFGAYAALAGWPPVASIVLSTGVFSGSAQFAYVTATAGGGRVLLGLSRPRDEPAVRAHAAAAALSLHGAGCVGRSRDRPWSRSWCRAAGGGTTAGR